MKNKFSIVALVSLVALATYCSNEYFGRYLTRQGTNEPASVTQSCANNGDCEVVNTYAPQPSEAGSIPAAIVLIIDTSASMDNDIDATAEALTAWFPKLQDLGLENFCVGVLLGHAGVHSGRYYSPDPATYPRCMCTTDYSVAEMADKMGYTLTHYTSSDLLAGGAPALTQGGEVNMYSLHTALTDPDVMALNEADGCFPSQYTIAPVLINDEDETMATPNGTQIATCSGLIYSGPNPAFAGLDMGTIKFDNSVFDAVGPDNEWNITDSGASDYAKVDNQCKEVQARLTWYSEETPTGPGGTYKLIHTPQSIADELISYNGSLPSFASGVGLRQGDLVVDGQAGPYNGVIDFAAIFGQTIANIKYTSDPDTQDDFEAELNTLAEAMVQTVTFIFGFDLFDEDGNPAVVCADEIDNVVVKINGSAVDPDDWTLNASRNRVNFDPGYEFDFGDVITVEFSTCD